MELELNITPSNGTIDDLVITSTPEAIIKKENGKWFVTGASIGTATITAESARSNFSKNFTLEILTNIVLVSEISTTTISDTLLLGESETFTVSVLPTNATNKTYTVTTSENISFVDDTNNNYTITSTSLGDGWVKIVANDASAVSTTKNITINNPVVLVSGLTFDIPETILQTDTLDTSTVVVAPADATNKTYTVAVVSGPATINGNTVSFSDVGEVNISITANDASGISINKIFEVTTA